MADRDPRESTDQETAPLLRDANTEESQSPLSRHVLSVLQEPLSPLTKILLVVSLLFLLLTSTFIGLFAGAQHNLSVERGHNGGGDPSTTTVTTTRISSSISTTTATSYSTYLSTTVSTVVSTTTRTSTVIAPGPGPTASPESPECLSPDCILLSAAVLSSLDTTQDACDSFYKFTTGGWLKTHPIPSDKGSLGNFEVLSQDNKRIIRQILEDDTQLSEFLSPNDAEILWKVRGLYASCMDEDVLNKRGLRPLMNVVKTIQQLHRGDHAVSSDGDLSPANRRGLTAVLAYLHSRSISSLFSFSIDGDVGRDPNLMSLWFGQPEFSLPSKEYYEDESMKKLYTDVLEKLLTTIYKEQEQDNPESIGHFSEILKEISKKVPSENDGLELGGLPEQISISKGGDSWPPWPWPPWGEDPKSPSERAKTHAKKVVALERSLAQATLDLDILIGDPYATYNPVTFLNFTQTLPQLDFATYLSTFGPRSFPEEVIVTDPSYAKFLSRTLDETPGEIIEAYLVSRAALSLSSNLGLDTETWKAARTLEEELKGIKKGAVGDRSEFCVSTVENTMGFAVGRYFVNETFAQDSKSKGTKVITDIIEMFKASLPKVEWMDEESASAASQKADAIRVKVGYPLSPNTTDPASLAHYYYSVHIEEGKFFENVLSSWVNDKINMWMKLGSKRDVESWEMYPSMVNAYFNPPANEIVFPAGILQPPFFHRKWPSYMNYGAFGMVSAHELTHAFDSSGRLYNQDGKLEGWWSNFTSDGFNVRQRCISKQYSSYTIDDGKGGKLHVNGELTSTENIGDSGLIQAYRAWNAQYDPNGNDFLLPGLNYTREQLFFIAFGRAWAQNIKPASAIARLRSDPHSPNRWRVDGTLRNIPEFGKAFNCPLGSPMNPRMEDRCILW